MTEITEDQNLDNLKRSQILDLQNHLGWKYIVELLENEARPLKENLLTSLNPKNNELKYSLNDLQKVQLWVINKIINAPQEVIWGGVVIDDLYSEDDI